ncbi:hypothetical protein C1752_13688 [Acaryochloris thomasi RCC1774]|uniref:Uncharacterized protein n=1 Tax=Acaryochloris thomasi RCC1774 TaxID=1764569 RepID=A0A2W1JM73_9CYAN|nr:hypothetical protein C1752_13688 [Acaryochloris thomasi RCC1774]
MQLDYIAVRVLIRRLKCLNPSVLEKGCPNSAGYCYINYVSIGQSKGNLGTLNIPIL